MHSCKHIPICEIATVAIWASSYATWSRFCFWILAHVQYLIDSLQAAPVTLSAKEYLDVILEGLPQGYDFTYQLEIWFNFHHWSWNSYILDMKYETRGFVRNQFLQLLSLRQWRPVVRIQFHSQICLRTILFNPQMTSLISVTPKAQDASTCIRTVAVVAVMVAEVVVVTWNVKCAIRTVWPWCINLLA